MMNRADVDALDLNAAHDLVFSGTSISNGGPPGGQQRTLTIQNLYVVNDPIRLRTGGDGVATASYLVEVTDVRYLAEQFSSINKAYNLRKPSPPMATNTHRYYSNSLNAGALWTWNTLVGDIWGLISFLGSAPSLPYTPTGTPEDLRFVGVSAWSALHEVLSEIGCTTAWNPVAGTFAIVRLGSTQSGLAASETSYGGRVMHNLDALDAKATRAPATIRVFFAYRSEKQGHNWPSSPQGGAYTVDKTTGITGAVAGTILPIWNHTPALYDFDSASVTNSSTLDTLAGEVRDNWVAAFDVQRKRKVYMGLVADILPGSEVRAVQWQDAGLGWRTIVSRRPETCAELWPDKKRWSRTTGERLHGFDPSLDFELKTALSVGGSATVYPRRYDSGWTTHTAQELTVYDNLGVFEGDPGAYGWAVWSPESERYEIRQMECPPG